MGRPNPRLIDIDVTPPATELITQCRHIVCYIDGNPSGLPFSIVIGQTTLSQQPPGLAISFEKFLDAETIPKPLTSLVNLTVPLQLFGLSQNNGQCNIIWPWTDRYRTALANKSHTVRLCFDQYDRPLPNLSAKQLYIAQHRDLLWHDTEAFASWVLGCWRALKIDHFSGVVSVQN